MKKIWTIKDKKSYSDEGLINAIKNGEVTGEDLLLSNYFDNAVKVSDTIYQFYMKEHENETI